MIIGIINIVFLIFIIYVVLKINKMNYNSRNANTDLTWEDCKNKYLLSSLVGTADSKPKIAEQITDDIGDQVLLVVSYYMLEGSRKLVFECFSQVGSDNDSIIESHKLIKIWNELTPEFYNVYYKAKDNILVYGVKEFMNSNN